MVYRWKERINFSWTFIIYVWRLYFFESVRHTFYDQFSAFVYCIPINIHPMNSWYTSACVWSILKWARCCYRSTHIFKLAVATVNIVLSISNCRQFAGTSVPSSCKFCSCMIHSEHQPLVLIEWSSKMTNIFKNKMYIFAVKSTDSTSQSCLMDWQVLFSGVHIYICLDFFGLFLFVTCSTCVCLWFLC